MNASECPGERLHVLADGELSAHELNETQVHLLACPACAQRLQDILSLKARVSGAGRTATPEGLEQRLRFTLTHGFESVTATPRRLSVKVRRLGAQAAALFITAALSAMLSGLWVEKRTRQSAVDQALVDAHVRAVTLGGEVQVTSSDSHNVRPWLTGRLDFAPESPDLSAHGFTLVGGRLDVVDGQRVGVLVYTRRQHRIDIFARPAAEISTPNVERAVLRGFNRVSWDARGLRYAAISDLDARELQELASLFLEH